MVMEGRMDSAPNAKVSDRCRLRSEAAKRTSTSVRHDGNEAPGSGSLDRLVRRRPESSLARRCKPGLRAKLLAKDRSRNGVLSYGDGLLDTW